MEGQLSMFDDERPRCKSCAAPLIWAITEATGSRMPVDADPAPGGTILLRYLVPGEPPLAHVTSPEERIGEPALHKSHFATCPNPDSHRRDKKWRPAADYEGARAARDEAIRQVDEAADPPWKDLAYDAVVRTARALPEFISDDVWRIGGLDSTREDRALGPVFQRISRDRVAERTDRVRPSVRSHLSGKPIWRSLVYRG